MPTLHYDTTSNEVWQSSVWEISTLNLSIVSAPPSLDVKFEGWNPEGFSVSRFEIIQPSAIDEQALRQLYMEFAEADHSLAEAGLPDYYEMLRQNDEE